MQVAQLACHLIWASKCPNKVDLFFSKQEIKDDKHGHGHGLQKLSFMIFFALGWRCRFICFYLFMQMPSAVRRKTRFPNSLLLSFLPFGFKMRLQSFPRFSCKIPDWRKLIVLNKPLVSFQKQTISERSLQILFFFLLRWKYGTSGEFSK